MSRPRKPYETVEWDVRLCAWCTNHFSRTKCQADRGVRYCCKRCAGFGRAVAISDAQYRQMNRTSQARRMAGRLARLAGTVDGLTQVDAYLKGYRSGFAAGKAKRKPLIPRVGGPTWEADQA